MWRRLAWTLCAASMMCWAGCGAGDPPARLPSTQVARARAEVVAHEVTLRAGDLPEYKAFAHSVRGQVGYEAVIHMSCRPAAHRGSVSPRPWAQASSQELSAGNDYHAVDALSNVAIMPTASAADLVVSGAREMDLACIEQHFRQGFATSGRPVRGVLVQPLATSVSGSGGSVAYQAVISWRGTPLVLYVDFTFFSYGQDAVELVTYHSSDPVPPAMQSRLLGLLVARARAHSR